MYESMLICLFYFKSRLKAATSIAQRARIRLKELLDKHYPSEPVIDRDNEKLLEEIYNEASADILGNRYIVMRLKNIRYYRQDP